jgi:glycine/D-amino acid oxidase-like deaminating enzyme
LTAEIAAAQQAAIDRIESIVRDNKIDCDFERVNGYMFQGLERTDPQYRSKILDEMYDAASRTGKLALTVQDDAGIPDFASGKAIRFGNQASFHPTKYVRALAKIVEAMGGKIHESTRSMTHEESDKQLRGIQASTADGQTISACQPARHGHKCAAPKGEPPCSPI